MMFHSHSFLTSQPLNTYQWPPSHPKWTQISHNSLPVALLTCEARGAQAKEGSWEIKAAGATGTWATQTLIHLHLTARAFEAYDTAGVSGTRVKVGFLSPLYLQCLNPSLPWRHSQWKDPGWSWHCPSLAQGELLHSLMSSSHREPVNPGGAGSGWGQVAKVIFFFL